jgi:hypothetical protein
MRKRARTSEQGSSKESEVRRRLGDIATKVQTAADATAGVLTGRNVEDAVHHYSEIYGEILLGMHHRIEALEGSMKSLESLLAETEACVRQANFVLDESRRLALECRAAAAKTWRVRTLSSAAMLIAVLSLAVAAWSIW